MTFSDKIANFFRGSEAHLRSQSVENELNEQKGNIRNTTQAIQSGARVIESMSSSMRLMIEIERERND